MNRRSTILAATDFSAHSTRAVDRARALALASGARLLVEHVLEHLFALDDLAGRAGPDIAMVTLSLEQSALQQLDEAIDERDRRELGGETRLVKATSAARGITMAAADAGADLIVVGTHGRTGMARLFGGSVAETVVRTAPCSVLVVRDGAGDPDIPASSE
jgi:nucleotide-binding universal stress UspA family protein